MRAAVWNSRCLALAVVFAVAGFCYGLSTSQGPSRPGVAARGVGTGGVPLQFTNPLFPGAGLNQFDLGDACFGSAITRYVTAAGGLRPYRFRSEGPQSLESVLEGTRSSLQLGISGVISGSAPVSFPTRAGVPPIINFLVTVTDARGSNAVSTSGFFNISLFNSLNLFRFGISELPRGFLASNYLTRVPVLGGREPLTFSIVSLSDGTGAALNLERDLGLSLSSDGTILGRPLRLGTFALTLKCVNDTGRVALNRANTTPNQTLALVIMNNPVTSTDLVTVSARVKGKIGSEGKDSLKYKGMINTLGVDRFQLLNSDFSFRLGGVGFSGRLDRKGRFSGELADGSKGKIKVNLKKGSVDISLRAATFDTALDAANLTTPTARKAVQVTIGEAVASSEVLDFTSKLSGLSYSLKYNLGRNGGPAAGAFQILSVKGTDSTTQSGLPGDKWNVRFISAPRSGVVSAGQTQGFDGATALTTRIGANFVQTVRGAELRISERKISFKSSSGEGVKSFALNSKSFKGIVSTFALSEKSTNIPQAIRAALLGEPFFQLGVDLERGTNAPFSGEHARRIYGLGKKFSDSPPSR